MNFSALDVAKLVTDLTIGKINSEIAKKMKDITGGLPIPPGFNIGF